MRAIRGIAALLLLLAAPARAGDARASDVLVSYDATPSPSPSPTPTPTPTPSPTPTPVPTSVAPSWATEIDHCWNFEGNRADSCSAVTPITLAIGAGTPTYTTSPAVAGNAVFLNGAYLAGNSTAEFAPTLVGADTLTMWCFVDFSSVGTDGGLMGKFATGNGYELWIDNKVTGNDLGGHEQTRAANIANVWSTTPSGWSFIWWRAKAGNFFRIGQWAGASTLNVGDPSAAAVVADAPAQLFKIGSSTTHGTAPAAWYDSCGWHHQNLQDQSLCRICSCNVDGAACTCSGAAFVNEGRRNTHCGGCALPPDCSWPHPYIL
jgi:hypothetical protein